MKNIITTTIFSFLLIFKMDAQHKAACDQIIGLWLTQNKDGKVEIFKSGNTYFGRLVWGNDMFEKDGKTSRKDINNPDPKLRNRPIQNFVFLTNFVYKDGIWDNGKIYDARTGTSYDCFMKYVEGKIEIRAFIGLHMFGKSEQWQRIR